MQNEISDMRGLCYRARHIMKHIPDDFESVLDIGCGLGDWGYILRTRYNRKFHLIGVDIHKPYIDKVKRFNLYDTLICQDIRLFVEHFPRGMYDVGIMFDVLEHLDKEDGIRVLNMLKLMCNKLIVTLPRGYLKQDPIDGNIYQKHISAWDVKDFKDLGFDVHLLNRGLRLIEFPFELIRWFFRKRNAHIIAVWNKENE